MSRRKRNLRRVSLLVTAQTWYHLQELARMDGHHDPGVVVVDKLTRERMLLFRRSGEEGRHGRS